jgi:hypothetical protein
MGGAALASSLENFAADDAGAENFRATLRRAQVYAEEQGHRVVTLEHLLLALTEDPDALAVFEASRIDVDRLRDDVAGYVSRITDRASGEGFEPALSPDLSRVVEAARQAAQQSRRQVVNGAIVLAALIGEGRSPASEFLKTHGLTFEEAIRTLQARSATSGRATGTEPAGRPAASTSRPMAPRAPSDDADDDILASIRTEIGQAAEDLSHERARPAVEAKPPPAPAASLRREPPLGQYEGDPGPRLDPVPSSQRTHPASPQAEPRTGRSAMPRGPHPNGGPALAAGSDRMRGPGPLASGPPPGAPGWRPPGPPPAGGVHRPMGPPPLAGRPPMPPGGHGVPPGAAQTPRMARPQGPARAARPPADAVVSEGTLLENIPRRMRVGVPEQVEVRIARAAFDRLGEGLGGHVVGHRLLVARAMSVRLRAPEGGFYIEATSPETQWVENTLGIMGDDFASWRWTVTPHYRGRARLQLVVSARSVGPDGLAAETALPEQVIEVRVRTNYGRSIGRIILWLAAMIAAGVIGAMGEAAFRFFTTIIGG